MHCVNIEIGEPQSDSGVDMKSGSNDDKSKAIFSKCFDDLNSLL